MPPAHISLGESITITARRQPEHTSFVLHDGSHHTFEQTNTRVNRLVWALQERGVTRGSRLAVFSLDSHRYIEIVLAAAKLGATYMPLNYRLSRGELDVLVSRARPAVFFYDSRYESLIDGIGQQHPSVHTVVRLDEIPGETTSPYERLLAAGHDKEPPVVSGDDDIIGLAFTSGTTGLPKGVLQSQRMLKSINATQLLEYRARPDDVRYVAAPQFHIAGMAMTLMGVAYGFTSVILPQFDAKHTQRLLAEDVLTGIFLVPTMISSILQLEGVEDHSYDRIRLMMYGAAPMPPSLLRRALDVFGCDFLQAFAAGTEAGLQVRLTPEDHVLALEGKSELFASIGKPAYGVDLRLVDDNMDDVPQGQVGEIATRSDMTMDGYLEMPEESARALRDGWFRAGDMARADEDGYLYLSGRKSDMIIRGGENIYPVEIESVLTSHPAVLAAAVVGITDEHWGETVQAWVVLDAAQPRPTAADLTAHCRGALASYKVPAEIIAAEQLPTNASGKVVKADLRSRAGELRSRDEQVAR